MTVAAVLGSGNWGTTFAKVMADAGCEVRIWSRDESACDEINADHRNSAYLPGIALPESITASTDPHLVISGADLVAIALPAQVVRGELAALRPSLGSDTIVLSLMKGVELGTYSRMSEVIAEGLAIGPERVVVVSGPNLAGEIALGQPAATVFACVDSAVAERAAHWCATTYFRPYTNTDVVGVELGGAIKNVIALAAGIAQGTGFGDNTKATIVTRGLVEMARLGVALGADRETFSGLAGMGDLVATCASPRSRNHSLGEKIGQGLTLDEAVAATGQTAEGVKSSLSVLELAHRVGVEMPITQAVVGVLYKGLPVKDMATLLLTRPYRSESVS